MYSLIGFKNNSRDATLVHNSLFYLNRSRLNTQRMAAAQVPARPALRARAERTLAAVTTPANFGHSLLAGKANELQTSLNRPLVLRKCFDIGGFGTTLPLMSIAYLFEYKNEPKIYQIFSDKVDRYLSFFVEVMSPATVLQAPPPGALEVLNRIMGRVHAELCTNAGVFKQEYTEIYRPAPAGGPDDRPAAMVAAGANITAFLAPWAPANQGNRDNYLAQITVVANLWWEIPNSPLRKLFYKSLFTILICIAKIGSITEQKLESIADQLRDSSQIALDVDVEQVSGIFKAVLMVCKQQDINPSVVLKESSAHLRMEDNLRMFLTVQQAVDSGVTAVTLTTEAIAKFPTSKLWNYFHDQCATELHAYVDAARIVANAPFVIFGNHAQFELVKSTRFPNVYYGARQLLLKMGGENNISKLKTATRAQKKIFIDTIVDHEIANAVAGLNIEDLRFGKGETVTTLIPGLQDILDTIGPN